MCKEDFGREENNNEHKIMPVFFIEIELQNICHYLSDLPTIAEQWWWTWPVMFVSSEMSQCIRLIKMYSYLNDAIRQ